MIYDDIIKHLFQINLSHGMKLGLQNIQRLQKLLNFPDRAFSSIHVAGTNGKGSVCTKVALALQQAGYRTGLYTSPHLSTFRERIRINGTMISEDAVTALMTQLFQLAEKEDIPATFFELTTLLAFLHFSSENVDIAVIETGIGGTFDATNIITPCLSIITSISLDHTEILGTSVEEIAKEKGGIIKPGIPVIIGPNVPYQVIQDIATKKQSVCTICNDAAETFEMENRLIAQQALNVLARSFRISDSAIKEGLEGRQPCRFEIVSNSPTTILDVAHNPDGLVNLSDALKKGFPSIPVRLIFGLSKSKDLQGCVKLLAKFGNSFHVIEALNGRGAPKDVLAEMLKHEQISTDKITIHTDISKAVEMGKREALKHGEILLICGSFFIMGEVRKALGFDEPHDFCCMNERTVSSQSNNSL